MNSYGYANGLKRWVFSIIKANAIAPTSPSTGKKGVFWNILKIIDELIRGSGCSISIGNIRDHEGI